MLVFGSVFVLLCSWVFIVPCTLIDIERATLPISKSDYEYCQILNDCPYPSCTKELRKAPAHVSCCYNTTTMCVTSYRSQGILNTEYWTMIIGYEEKGFDTNRQFVGSCRLDRDPDCISMQPYRNVQGLDHWCVGNFWLRPRSHDGGGFVWSALTFYALCMFAIVAASIQLAICLEYW